MPGEKGKEKEGGWTWILKSKTFWAAVACFCYGAIECMQGNPELGVSLILIALQVLGIRDRLQKIYEKS